MLKRDEHAIIVQGAQKGNDDPAYSDGGDSFSRTGIMAYCGSEIDQQLISWFFTPEPVRHPWQAKWNDPKEMSRDNLICGSIGCVVNPVARGLLKSWIEHKKGFFINKDILLPQHWAHLYRCTGKRIGFMFQLVSDIGLFLDVLWSAYITPDKEQNQIMCMVGVRGEAWLSYYLFAHPYPDKALDLYWDGWRDQPEIEIAMRNKFLLRSSVK